MSEYQEELVAAEILADGSARIIIGDTALHFLDSTEIRKLAGMVASVADWVDEELAK